MSLLEAHWAESENFSENMEVPEISKDDLEEFICSFLTDVDAEEGDRITFAFENAMVFVEVGENHSVNIEVVDSNQLLVPFRIDMDSL